MADAAIVARGPQNDDESRSGEQEAAKHIREVDDTLWCVREQVRERAIRVVKDFDVPEPWRDDPKILARINKLGGKEKLK
jgi:hypothetical protein